MLWRDIQTLVETMIDEKLSATGRFTPFTFRAIGGQVARQISERCRCIQTSYALTTVSGTQFYGTGPEVMEIVDARYDTTPLVQLFKRPIVGTEPDGVPYAYIVEGNNIGFYPTPNAVATVDYWLRRRSIPYAFEIVHTPDSGNTELTVAIVDTSITFTFVGGADSALSPFTINCADSATNTIGEIVSTINSGLSTIQVTRNSLCPSTTVWTNVEIMAAFDIYDSEWHVMFEPDLPDEAQNALIEGIVWYLKYKDRELNASSFVKSGFYQEMERLRVHYAERFQTNTNHRIQTKTGPMRGSRFSGNQVHLPVRFP